MKRINIYLTDKDKKRLEDLKWKYHVSYSTIANACVMALVNTEIGKLKEYIYKEKGKKTSIKPKLEWKEYNNSLLYTNCLKAFLNDEIKKYTNEETNKKQKNKIINYLNTTFEENWNGNYFNRLMPKLLKKNKEYYKKVLELK